MTPIFLLNARYDWWQLLNNLELGCLPPKCTDEQMMQFEKFGVVRCYDHLYCIECNCFGSGKIDELLGTQSVKLFVFFNAAEVMHLIFNI